MNRKVMANWIWHALGTAGSMISLEERSHSRRLNMSSTRELKALARRDLLRTTVAGGIGLGIGLASGLGVPRRARAQSTLTPDEALKTLMDGNARFVAGRLTSFQEDLTILAQKTAEK